MGTSQQQKLKIAIIGQSNFASEVLDLILSQGHEVVGVFTIPDKGAREDILAVTAKNYNIPLFKISAWRKKGIVIPEVLEQYKTIGANLNVLPFCSQFIPMEVIDGASLGSICYHPSILPRHRGASSISWTLIEGDEIGGFTIFWADDGLDTGPILLQKQCSIESNDTLDTFYKRFLYPEGITAMGEAVAMVAAGNAPKNKQTEVGATYDPTLSKEDNQKINLDQTGSRIFNFIRGLDSVPGALTYVITEDKEEIPVRLFGASLFSGSVPSDGKPLTFKGLSKPAIIHEGGLLITGTDGKLVNVLRIKKGSRVISASKWFEQSTETVALDLTEAEKLMEATLRGFWTDILKTEIDNETDFFACGAASMDVVRLVEEVKDAFEISMENEVLFMAPVFGEFFVEVIKAVRQGSSVQEIKVEFDGFTLKANKKVIEVPTQLFIDGKFVDAENKKTIDIINPTTEEVICKVACASKNDVDVAVKAAHKAFYGPWSLISARQRGQLMFKLADLMEESKEELATIEAIDSGAVYTLALKTHVGMSIDAFRYFAGWTDKIEGSTIPTSAARPNNVLTFTKKEPIG